MGKWSITVNSILTENHMKIWLACGYIDDMRYLTPAIEAGTRWCQNEKKLVKKEEWRLEDEKSGESSTKRTSREVGKIMNSVFKNITFTTETEEDFADGRLPTLDFSLFIERGEAKPGDEQEKIEWRKKNKGKLLYSFFEKTMTSKYCIMERSALSENMKTASLSQEVIRRMLNMSEEIPQEERNEVLEKFISKMETSGYSQEKIKNIVISGLKGYETKLKRARIEKRGIHRDGKSNLGARTRKKLMAKTTRYKKRKNQEKREASPSRKNVRSQASARIESEKPPTAVVFVPRAPNGALAVQLRQLELEMQKLSNIKIKIVEEGGDMVKDLIHKSNPWAGENCLREACLVCRRGEAGQGDCQRRNVVYKTWCLTCQKRNRDSLYLGETARTAFERGGEHSRDFKTKKENSHMFCHHEQEHLEKGEEAVFAMKVVRSHKSALERQINEAVLIANSWGSNLLNSKLEYNRCIIPTLSVKMGEQEVVSREQREAQEKECEEVENLLVSSKRSDREFELPGAKRVRRRKKEFYNSKGKRSYEGEVEENATKRRRIRSCNKEVGRGVRTIREMFENLTKKSNSPEKKENAENGQEKLKKKSKNCCPQTALGSEEKTQKIKIKI